MKIVTLHIFLISLRAEYSVRSYRLDLRKLPAEDLEQLQPGKNELEVSPQIEKKEAVAEDHQLILGMEDEDAREEVAGTEPEMMSSNFTNTDVTPFPDIQTTGLFSVRSLGFLSSIVDMIVRPIIQCFFNLSLLLENFQEVYMSERAFLELVFAFLLPSSKPANVSDCGGPNQKPYTDFETQAPPVPLEQKKLLAASETSSSSTEAQPGRKKRSLQPNLFNLMDDILPPFNTVIKIVKYLLSLSPKFVEQNIEFLMDAYRLEGPIDIGFYGVEAVLRILRYLVREMPFLSNILESNLHDFDFIKQLIGQILGEGNHKFGGSGPLEPGAHGGVGYPF